MNSTLNPGEEVIEGKPKHDQCGPNKETHPTLSHAAHAGNEERPKCLPQQGNPTH